MAKQKKNVVKQGDVNENKGEGLFGKMDLSDVFREAVEADVLASKAKQDYEAEREQTVGTVAEHLRQIACKFRSAEQFVEACKLIEQSFKGEDAIGRMRKIDPQFDGKAPRCWTQAKSNIKQAWEKFGIDPKDCENVHQLRKRLGVKREQEKAAKHPRIEQAKDAEVAMILAPLAAVLNGLSEQKDSKAAEQALEAAITGLKAIHTDAHKVLNNIMKDGKAVPKAEPVEQKVAVAA